MKFARRVHSNTTLKGGEGRMEIEYLKKQLNYVQVSQLFLSKIVGSGYLIILIILLLLCVTFFIFFCFCF